MSSDTFLALGNLFAVILMGTMATAAIVLCVGLVLYLWREFHTTVKEKP